MDDHQPEAGEPGETSPSLASVQLTAQVWCRVEEIFRRAHSTGNDKRIAEAIVEALDEMSLSEDVLTLLWSTLQLGAQLAKRQLREQRQAGTVQEQQPQTQHNGKSPSD